MGTFILRFAQSVQDAVHKKLQPLGSLMLGDNHDGLRDCGGGRDEARGPSFVYPQVVWHAQGDQILLSPSDSGIIPVQYTDSNW